MALQYGIKPPAAPRVSTSSFQVSRNTTGYRDPFPALSGYSAPAPAVPPLRTDASSGGGYGQQPARPPAQQPAVNPQATAQTQAPPQTPTVGYDYNADPILNQIQAISTQGRADAAANAQALRLQLAQQYGDQGLARQYGTEADAAAAAANPNSVLAQLAHNYQQAQSSLEEALNQANLHYSGARVKQLGELSNQYQGQVAGATGQERSALDTIAANLAAAQHAADLQDQQAAQDAYNRQLQAALAAAYATQPQVIYTGGGGGGGDTGGGGGEAPPPDVPQSGIEQALAAGLNQGLAGPPVYAIMPYTQGPTSSPYDIMGLLGGGGAPPPPPQPAYGSAAQRRRQAA